LPNLGSAPETPLQESRLDKIKVFDFIDFILDLDLSAPLIFNEGGDHFGGQWKLPNKPCPTPVSVENSKVTLL
jgi:hypothetical protein